MMLGNDFSLTKSWQRWW